MAEAAKAPTIIIIKKKKAAHGHHGGAWKVAYADFVTAMMALFIVLWLLSSSQKVQKAVGGYFRDPEGKGRQTGSGQAGVGESFTINKDDMPKLKEKLEDALRQSPEFPTLKDQVQVTVTGEGLRIELMETEQGTFFQPGNSQPSKQGTELLANLAQELGKLPNTIAMEGHTDARPFASNGSYSNWELSADRANSARRLMKEHGLKPEQVVQVRGFADQRLRKPDAPGDASNRRISVIVQYQNPFDDNGATPAAKEKASAEHEAKPAGEHGAKPAAEHEAKPAGEHAAKEPAVKPH